MRRRKSLRSSPVVLLATALGALYTSVEAVCTDCGPQAPSLGELQTMLPAMCKVRATCHECHLAGCRLGRACVVHDFVTSLKMP